MAILITGGTGFIGARIARRLTSDGHKVVSFDLIPNLARFGNLNNAKVVQGDVTSTEELVDVIRDNDIEAIVHTARSSEAASLQTFFRVAAYGTNCLFEAARIAGVRRVVFCSSIAYHGSQDNFGERPVTEDDPGFPYNPYSVFKMVNEVMATAYNVKHDMEIIAVRPSIVYGPGKGIGWVWVNEVATNPAIGKPAVVPYHRGYRILALHVDDNAELFSKLATASSVAHRVYHTGGEMITAGQLGNIVKRHIPGADITYPDKIEKESMIYLVDSSRAVKEFNLTYRPVEQGILELIKEARGNG